MDGFVLAPAFVFCFKCIKCVCVLLFQVRQNMENVTLWSGYRTVLVSPSPNPPIHAFPLPRAWVSTNSGEECFGFDYLSQCSAKRSIWCIHREGTVASPQHLHFCLYNLQTTPPPDTTSRYLWCFIIRLQVLAEESPVYSQPLTSDLFEVYFH